MGSSFKEINYIKGIKNDEDQKNIPIDFLYNIQNFNYSNSNFTELEKILMPERILKVELPEEETFDFNVPTLPVDASFLSVAYGDGLYVILTNSTTALVSEDTVLWNNITVPTGTWNSITYGNGLFVAVGSHATNQVMTSPNGLTWTLRTAAASSTWTSVVWGGSQYVAVASTGATQVMTSPDGITWTARTAPAGAYNGITYGNNTYVVIGSGATRVMTSSDGITWTARTAANLTPWYGVIYGGGLFVAVGDNTVAGDGSIMTSSDGITWTERFAPEDNPTDTSGAGWKTIAYGNGYYIALASFAGAYNIITSSDAINWEFNKNDIPNSNLWQNIIYSSDNNDFVMVTNYVLSSNKVVTIDFIDLFGAIDGLFEYKFLNEDNVLKNQKICVSNGRIFKDALTNPTVIKEGLSTGKCDFRVLNDKLYIANGKDYVWVYDGLTGVVSQMGAPIVTGGDSGLLNGSYYWAMTYVTAGGEENIGSISNTLSLENKKAVLKLPIGYDGTTSRKIYRTEAGGTTLKLVTTIADNTTLTYEDNTADGSLTTEIIGINNELPKPYHLAVFAERLIGVKVDKYPTQIFISDTEIDVFDLANGLDISNYGDDNSSVVGVGVDFSKVVIGTEKFFYLVDIGASSISITLTRVNVGLKSGYSIVRIPTYGNFNGGLMFVSSNNDIRILVGLKALPVATSIDNIYSEDLSSNIRGTLLPVLESVQNIYAEYFNYKYHLIINGDKYVFDIRNGAWTYHKIQTTNYKSNPLLLAVLDNLLYNGQEDGYIEQEYRSIQYRLEDVEAILESGELETSNIYKHINKFIYWFTPNENNKLNIEVTKDGDIYNKENYDFDFISGAYDENDFSSADYEIANDLDYKVFNIYNPSRWIKWKITISDGNILFSKWGIFYKRITGQE